MFRKVIVSQVGELTQDARTVGDSIRYRIYFPNETRVRSEVVITDKLPKGLSGVTVYQGGEYDPSTRTATWSLKGFRPARESFVEVEAVIGEVQELRNVAALSADGRRQTSNTVTTVVAARPGLVGHPSSFDG